MTDDKRFGSKAIIAIKEKPQRLLISILVGNQTINIVATLVFTIVLILFGSLLPKTLALRYSEIISRALAYPLLGFITLARLVVRKKS